MTLDELRALVARSKDQGLDFAIATIPCRNHRGARVRIAPGLLGRCVGETEKKLVVEVRIADIARLVERIEAGEFVVA